MMVGHHFSLRKQSCFLEWYIRWHFGIRMNRKKSTFPKRRNIVWKMVNTTKFLYNNGFDPVL
jgi:hypothetical protein